MTEEARARQRQYNNSYRAKHKDEINARQRAWAKQNPDKIREYQARHWERVANREDGV